MDKKHWQWHSERLPAPARVVRWGHWGTPVLLFPTAGGDYEEVERFHLIRVLAPLIDAGRIKVYSTDSIAGKTWIEKTHSPEYCARVQNLFDAFIYHELVPLIHAGHHHLRRLHRRLQCRGHLVPPPGCVWSGHRHERQL